MKQLSSSTLQIIELQECTSTNDVAWDYFQNAHWTGNPVVVTAQMQTKGRGRQGRVWQSEPTGNLYASLLVTPPSECLSWLPLAAGLATVRAISRALHEVSGDHDLKNLRLKWPNDIMWGAKKGGGILCESRFSGDQCLGVVVGLGLNITSAPLLQSDLETTSLQDELAVQNITIDAQNFRHRFLKLWCLDLLHWATLLDLDSTVELQNAWNEWAKLQAFPDLKTHAADGTFLNLKALELGANGKLKAEILGEGKDTPAQTVYLDQAVL